MRGSLDDLIRFLLEEIALCGEQGARSADILNYIGSYYTEQSKTRDVRGTTIDRAFQEQVWKWLTRHPEIQVGRQNRGNQLSLSEVEAWNSSEGFQDGSKGNSTTAEQTVPGDSVSRAAENTAVPSSLPPQPTSAPQGDVAVTSSQPQPASEPVDEPVKNTSLRVYTSQSRMWYAAAGHTPDYNRIPRLDFVLLSIIAARRGKGILQPDLVRVSGQDQRSVPKRTQRLHDGGYIEKKAVHAKGNRTSLCILKRFATEVAVSKRKSNAVEDSASLDVPDRSLTVREYPKSSIVEVEPMLHGIFDILRELEIITWDDLKRRLGIWRLTWESSVVANAIRKLETMGCVKRVRATGNYKRPGQAYYRCVKLIRELEHHELQAYLESQRGIADSLKAGDGDDIDAEGEDDEDYLPGGIHYEAPGNGVQGLELQEVGRLAPQWIADQNITNFIYDLVHNTGTKGISTMDMKTHGFGDFFSRPLEHQLSRLVDLWQLSQPPHLRHLAIIRDTALTKKIAHYVHYSFDNFKVLVDSGKASWEAVEIVTDNKKKTKVSAATVDTESDMDEHGFSKVQASRFQGRNNDATLLECVLASKAEPFYITSFDPIATQLANGTYGIRWGTWHGVNAIPRSKGPPRPMRSSKQNLVMPNRAMNLHDRPRKYQTGLAQKNVENMTPKELRKLKISQAAAARYARKKQISEAVARRVEAGEDPVAAREAVVAEVAAPQKEKKKNSSAGPNIDEDVARRVEAGEDPLAAREAVLAEVAALKKETKQARSAGPKGKAAGSTPHTQAPLRRKKRKASTQIDQPLGGDEYAVDMAGEAPGWLTAVSEAPANPENNDANGSDLPSLLSVTKFIQPVPEVEAVVQQNHGPQPTGATSRPYKKRNKPLKAGDDAMTTGETPDADMADSKIASYKALSRDIPRPAAGIFVGPKATRKIGRGRPRKARLAIFKSSRLAELPSFFQELVTSGETATIGNAATSIPQLLGPSQTSSDSTRPSSAPPFVQQPVDQAVGQPLASSPNYVSPSVQKPNDAPVRPNLDYVSPYDPSTARKRKRISSLEKVFMGPRRGFFEVSPLVSASTPKKRKLSKRPVPNLESLAKPSASTPREQTGPEKLIGEVADLTQQETTSNQGGRLDSETEITAINISIVARSSGATPIIMTNEQNKGPESIVIDPANGHTSDSQSTTTDTDFVGYNKNTEEIVPADEHNTGPEPTVLDGSPASVGDPNTAGRLPAEEQSVDLSIPQLGLDGPNSNYQNAAADPGLVEYNRSSEMTTSIEGHNKSLELTSGDGFPATVKDCSPSGRPTGGQQSNDLPVQRPSLDVPPQSSLEIPKIGSPSSLDTRSREASFAASATEKQAHADSQNLPDDGLPIMHIEDAMVESSVKSSSKRKDSRSITRITPNSGSIGVLRQKIIMDVVEACGGVFPGDKELWYPFTTAWMQRMPPGSGKPDSRTIKTAKKALIASGKLRQLRFTFLNKQEEIVGKGMITTADIRSNSPVVKDLQRKMIAQDPWLYVPQEAVVAEELRRSNSSAVVFGTNKTTAQLEVDEETQVKLQYVPAYVKRAAINKAAAERKRAATEKRKRRDQENKTEERRQAAEEKRRVREEEVQNLLGEPDFAIDGYRSGQVTLESEQAGTSEFRAYEGASPPPVRRPGRPPGPLKEGAKPKAQRLARIRRPSPSRVLQTSLPLPSLALPGQSDRTGPLSGLRRLVAKPALSIEQPATESITRTSLRPRQRVDYVAVNRGRTPPEGPQTETWTLYDQMAGPKLRFTKPLGLNSNFDRSPSPELEVGMPWTTEDIIKPTFPLRTKHLWPPRFNASYDWQRVSTLMDPDHCFHPATGTYSVSLSVFRNVCLGLGIYSDDEAYTKPVLTHGTSDLISHSGNDHLLGQPKVFQDTKSQFEVGIDDVLLWEMNAPNRNQTVSRGWLFINHRMSHPHQVAKHPSKIHFTQPRSAKTAPRSLFKARRASAEEMATVAPAKRKVIVLKLEPRHLASLGGRLTASNVLHLKDRAIHFDADGRPHKKVKMPGPARSNYLSVATEKRLMTAVVVIRILTGGLEGNVDWNLVARLFQSTHSAKFVHNRWASLRIKYRLQIDKMQADFQDLYARAYEDNLVPPLDFENIESYDWAWLVDWTQKHLGFESSQSLPDLPASRAQLDHLFDLRATKEIDLTEFYSLDLTATLVRRQAMLHREPMVAPLAPKFRKPANSDLQRLEVAKSWLRANAITPDPIYNPTVAHQKLSSLPEVTISSALESLLSDHVLAQEHKGRLVPGRNYTLSDHVLTRLKNALEVPLFLRANFYKLELDKSFAEHGKAEFSYHADDGDVLALTNLVAHRRVKLVPRDPPMNTFGLTDGGYKTRFMDKSRLTFIIDVYPTSTYTPGLPSLPPPPSPAASSPKDPQSKLPLWIDIHGNLVPDMWDLALAAVLSLVALRPGTRAEEVVKGCSAALGTWEVEMVWEWLVRAGVAERTSGGSVLVGEGWWGCVGRWSEGGRMGIGKEKEGL